MLLQVCLVELHLRSMACTLLRFFLLLCLISNKIPPKLLIFLVFQIIWKLLKRLEYLKLKIGSLVEKNTRNSLENAFVVFEFQVDNISYNTTQADLRRLFDKYGEIGDIHIPRDKYTRQSKGFGFVRFYRFVVPFLTCLFVLFDCIQLVNNVCDVITTCFVVYHSKVGRFCDFWSF